ncbi:hypothetical protein [Camelimonas lactis]|uniref:Uncharacterized protein n=1 Tax=Camelimonas lactis TaxID=659006 RepID=A0A4R2GW27_9HYPH|nr:hypothetical protein [Camelimonas lactis]TCO15211.1 hypothetical protein EV666_102189 [Camelimonas lactis]
MAVNDSHQVAILGAIGNGETTLDALVAHLPIKRAAIVHATSKLVGRGLIVRIRPGHFALAHEGKVFLAEGRAIKVGVTRSPRNGPYRHNSFTQRAWNAMRIRKRFTVPEIAMLAALETDKAPEDRLSIFFRRLADVGYLSERAERAPGVSPLSRGRIVWTLTKDTGPVAPSVIGRINIRDHNTGEDIRREAAS